MRLGGGLDYSDLLGDHLKDDISTSESEESEVENVIPDIRILHRETSLKKQNIEFLISKQNKCNVDILEKNLDKTKLEEVTREHEENIEFIRKTQNLDVNNLNNNNNRNSLFFKSTELIKLKNTKINQGVLQGLNIFHRKYQTGYVDVYWLYDDGGKLITSLNNFKRFMVIV